MAEIIPTILVKKFSEVKERIKAVENYVQWVQLDIMDGIFVDNKTWPYYAKASKGENSPKDLKNFKTKVKLEAHLMVEKPEEVIEDWLKVADRVIVHYESKISDIKKLIEKVHAAGRQIGLAINPETPIEVVRPYISTKRSDHPSTILDLVLCMTVQPGWGGQEFREEVLVKIKSLREIWPDGNIEVDGGVNDENIGKIVEAGANLICAGTFIFTSKNIKETIANLI